MNQMNIQKSSESQGIRLLKQLILQGKRIFNMQDVAGAILEDMPETQIRKILSNLAKHGHIVRLRRGMYVYVGLLREHANPHPFVVSTHLIQPSAVSHWSALHHHGLLEQIPHIVTAATPHKVITPSMRKKQPLRSNTKHAWVFNDVRYEYINVQQKHFFGLEKIWLDEHFQVSITDKERTLLDMFIYPKMFGGVGEAMGILENALTTIDIQKLVNYAVQYKKKSLSKRLGWALEYFGIAAEYLKPLLNVPINYYCRLDPSSPATGSCDKRWMIQNNLTKVKNK